MIERPLGQEARAGPRRAAACNLSSTHVMAYRLAEAPARTRDIELSQPGRGVSSVKPQALDEALRSRWQRALYGSGPARVMAILAPGLGVAAFVYLLVAVLQGSSGGVPLGMAALALIVVSLGYWRESRVARLDRKVAEELSRRECWDEAIESAGRSPGLDLIWRGTIWIATDKRLIQASRQPWWRRRQPPFVHWSVDYDEITAILSVRTRSRGEGPGFTRIVLALGSKELKMEFSPRKAKAILASVVDHTELGSPR